MALIGVSGKANSGKDTVGKIIQYLIAEKHQANGLPLMTIDEYIRDWDIQYDFYDWQIVKFADKVKDIVCLIIGCTREELEDEEFKNKELGEEWRVWKIINNKASNYGGVYSNKKDAEVSLGFCSMGGYNVTSELLTPRKLMQLIGTDVGRTIHPNTWINATMKDYKGNAFEFTNGTNHIKKMGNLPYTVKNLAKVGVTDYKMVNHPNWIITDCRFPNEIKAIEDRGGFVIRVIRPIISSLNSNIQLVGEHESETSLDSYDFKYTITNDGTIDELIEQVKLILIMKGII